MKKLSLSCFLLLLLPALAFSQVSKIVGTVTDSTGAPIIYAFIVLKPGGKGTTSDLNGNFTIADVSPGSYHLEISAVGFAASSHPVEVSGGIQQVAVSLKHLPTMLNEIVVTSRRGDERKENLTSSITLIGPQTVNELQTINSNPADILAMSVPGLAVSSGSTRALPSTSNPQLTDSEANTCSSHHEGGLFVLIPIARILSVLLTTPRPMNVKKSTNQASHHSSRHMART